MSVDAEFIAHPLELDDLHVAFGGNRVLRGVDLDMHPGFNGLIGPNGSGKTTIFNVISGYVTPYQGDVRIGGHSVVGEAQHARVRLGVGRTFQSPKLVLDATVMENVLLGYQQHYRWGHIAELFLFGPARAEEREARRKAMELLELFELDDVAHEKAGNLSLGVQKIVEVVRALIGEPRVLLLDEPAAGLGAGDVTTLLGGLRRVVEDRTICTVVIEHDLELVTTLCPTVSALHHGTIIASGTPQSVVSDPGVIEAYLGHSYAGDDGEGA